MPSPYRLDHIAIHARDFDASVRFYGELLGLPEVENPMGSGWIRWFEIAPGTNLHLVPGNEEPCRSGRSAPIWPSRRPTSMPWWRG
jgi:catechol 2,3-dioxygenase-like lactoylglutathione lyase family enzyme